MVLAEELNFGEGIVTVERIFNDPITFYKLYKCNDDDMGCMVLYSYEGGGFVERSALTVSKSTNEILLFHFSYLVYSDGQYPHEYKHIDSGEFGTYNFGLYTFEKNLAQEFVIVRCKSKDYEMGSCEILPFRYSTTSFKKTQFINDKNSEVIKLMIDDQLIFTYDQSSN